MEYNRQTVDGIAWRSLVTELPMGCLYCRWIWGATAAKRTVCNREWGPRISIDDWCRNSDTLLKVRLTASRIFFYKFLHRFFTTTGKMPSGLKLPFLSSWGSQFPDFSSAVTFDNIDLTCVSYLRHAFLCSCLVHRPYCFVRNRETTSFFKLASWRIFYIIYVPSVRFESISYT